MPNRTQPDSSATSLIENNAVKLTRVNNVGLVVIDRENKRNAINDEVREGLIAAIDLTASEPQIRALVITGAGKAFCAGGDIQGMEERLQAPAGTLAMNGWNRQRRNNVLITRLYDLPKPTIAAVNGSAAGLGCDLAMACDFVVGCPDSRFIMSFVLRGLIPDGGGMYFLPRRIGMSRAKDLIYSGRPVDYKEAQEIGMIDDVFAAETLVDDALAKAETLSNGSPTSIALSKTILNKSFEMSLDGVLAHGCQAQAICYTSDEHRSSVEKFLQSRNKKKL